MSLREVFAAARAEWTLMTFYQRFEHLVILVLTGLIAIVVVFCGVEFDAEASDQHPVGEFVRSDRLFDFPGDIRNDPHGHHCPGIQAIAIGRGGTTRRCCASPHRHSHCSSGHRPKDDYYRSREH